MRGNALEPVRSEVAHAGPLVGTTEDAGDAAQPRPAQPVGRRRHDAVAAEHLPHRRLGQPVDWPRVVDVAAPAGASAGVRAVRLEGGVARPCPAPLGTPAGDDQRPPIQEPILVADQRCDHLDLEVGGTPALVQVGRHLGESARGCRPDRCCPRGRRYLPRSGSRSARWARRCAASRAGGHPPSRTGRAARPARQSRHGGRRWCRANQHKMGPPRRRRGGRRRCAPAARPPPAPSAARRRCPRRPQRRRLRDRSPSGPAARHQHCGSAPRDRRAAEDWKAGAVRANFTDPGEPHCQANEHGPLPGRGCRGGDAPLMNHFASAST